MKRLMFVVLILSSFIGAQAHEPKAYFSRMPGFFTPPQMTVDGKPYDANGFTYRFEIADAMKSNPEAFQQAQIHEESMTRSSLYLWGGVGIAIAYLFSQRQNYNAGIYWGIFGTGLVFSVYEQRKGHEALNRAITIYNKEF